MSFFPQKHKKKTTIQAYKNNTETICCIPSTTFNCNEELHGFYGVFFRDLCFLVAVKKKKLGFALTRSACEKILQLQACGCESQKRQLETYWSVKCWSIGSCFHTRTFHSRKSFQSRALVEKRHNAAFPTVFYNAVRQ